MLENLNTYQEMIGEKVFFLYEDKMQDGVLFAINIAEKGIIFKIHFVKENLKESNEEITFATEDISATANGMYIRAIQAYDKMIRANYGEVEAKLKIKIPSKAVAIPIEAWVPEEIEGKKKGSGGKGGHTSKRLTKDQWTELLENVHEGRMTHEEAAAHYEVKLSSMRSKYCVWKKNNFEL